MIAPLLAVAVASAGLGPNDSGTFSYLGTGVYTVRPIASFPPYPPNMADDVRRPGFNGRLWVTRPVIGGMEGPYPVVMGPPGMEAYGAYLDNPGEVVPVRVGHTQVEVSPWERIEKVGLQHLEYPRSYWLYENNYTGGVRTFVNDTVIWAQAEGQPSPQESGQAEPPRAEGGEVQPRATIQVPADMPRARHRLRVQGAGPGETVAMVPGVGPARISWPMVAPADAVARTALRGGEVGGPPVSAVIVRAK